MANATQHVAVRLDEETITRVDSLIPVLSMPWRKARRSDVLRALIVVGLEEHAKTGSLPPEPPRQRDKSK